MTRRVALAALVAAVVLLATGTGAFTSASADRDTDVNVVPDEFAYLGIEVGETSGFVGGDPFPLLDLSNNFGQPVGVDAVDVASSAPVSVRSATMGGPVRVTCEAPATGETVTLTVEVSGEGVYVLKHKDVRVTCEEPEVRGVDFNGCGSAHVEVHGPPEAVTVTKTLYNPGTDTTDTSTTSPGHNGVVQSRGDAKLVAIEDEDGTTYTNPNQCRQTQNGQQSNDGNTTSTPGSGSENENGSGDGPNTPSGTGDGPN